MIISVAKICHFVTKKRSQATWSKELLKSFQKTLSNFKEENDETVKIFGRFGQVYSFLLLKSSY